MRLFRFCFAIFLLSTTICTAFAFQVMEISRQAQNRPAVMTTLKFEKPSKAKPSRGAISITAKDAEGRKASLYCSEDAGLLVVENQKYAFDFVYKCYEAISLFAQTSSVCPLSIGLSDTNFASIAFPCQVKNQEITN